MKELWTCPICGRTFRTRNSNHSCGLYALEDHFEGKAPIVRDLYNLLVAEMEGFDPLSVHPVKTRIVFQAEVQFAAAVTHRNWLEVIVWLRRQAHHPRLQRVEMQVFRDYGHVFRLSRMHDLDEDLLALLKEAYMLGLAAG